MAGTSPGHDGEGDRSLSRRPFANPAGPTQSALTLRLLRPQALGVDVDDEGGEQDQAADQDLQEAVNVDMVEAVVEHAQHEEADDGVGNAALAAEEAGAAPPPRRRSKSSR